MNEMIKRAVEAMQDAWEGDNDDPPPLEVLARAAIEGIRSCLKTEDFTYSEAEAIRRFLEEALE